GDPGRLVGPFADHVWPQQGNAGSNERLAGHGAADADKALVGEDLHDGVEVFLGFVPLGPTAVHRTTREARDANIDGLHLLGLLWNGSTAAFRYRSLRGEASLGR